MAALHRLQWIDAEIRAGRHPNARRVAEQFEISARRSPTCCPSCPTM